MIVRKRHVRVRRVLERTYGYVGRSEEHYQDLIEVTRLWGVPILRRVIDVEHVPAWAWIEQGCFGATAWRSKFAAVISGTGFIHWETFHGQTDKTRS